MRISDWSSDVCSSDLRLGDVGAAEQVDLHHQVEILHRHLGKAFVAQDTGVVDQDVDAAPFRLRLGDHLDHLVIFGDAAAVDRKSVVKGKSVSVRVDIGGRRINKKKTKKIKKKK